MLASQQCGCLLPVRLSAQRCAADCFRRSANKAVHTISQVSHSGVNTMTARQLASLACKEFMSDNWVTHLYYERVVTTSENTQLHSLTKCKAVCRATCQGSMNA